MRTLLVFGLLMAAPLSAAAVYGPKKHSQSLPTGPKINVLLEKNVNSVFLEVKGGYQVTRKNSSSALSFGSGKRFVVHALQDGLRWGEEYPDVYQFSIVPKNAKTSIFVNGIQYKGEISVYHVSNNQITVVNEVSIEDYLKSTLALQRDLPSKKEALSAWIIAARTEIYTKMTSCKQNRPWHISAQDSGYYGYGVTQQKNNMDNAVDLTRYMVINAATPLETLDITYIDGLAQSGLNAQKILQTSFPNQKLGLTIDEKEVTIR